MFELKRSVLVTVLALASTASAQMTCATNIVWAGKCICRSNQEVMDDGDENFTCSGNLFGSCSAPSPGVVDARFMELTVTEMDGISETVPFLLKLPTTSGRQYTNIYFLAVSATAVDEDCQANIITALNVAAPTEFCEDELTMNVPFTKLGECGFAVSTLPAVEGKQIWDGMIRLMYDDEITIGTGDFASTQTRTSTIDYPYRVEVQSQYTFDFQASNIKVYAPEQIDFALLDLILPKDDAPATAKLAYTVQYPYAITAWGGVVTKNSAGAVVNEPTASISPFQSQCGALDYAASDISEDSTCYKDNTLLTIAKQDACNFEDIFRVAFNVQCGANINAEDCPLEAAVPRQVEFSLSSVNFCTANAASNVINGVITLEDFYAASLTGWAVTHNAWRLGDDAHFVMKFDGLPLDSVVLSRLDAAMGPQGDALTDYVTVRSDSVVLGGFNDNAVVNAGSLTGNLGLQESLDEYRFRVNMNADLLPFVNDIAVRGQEYHLRLRAVMDVTYSTEAFRRRRQAVSTGRGSIESATQTIQAVESSAACITPVLAFTLALVATVVMA